MRPALAATWPTGRTMVDLFMLLAEMQAMFATWVESSTTSARKVISVALRPGLGWSRRR